LWIFSGSKAVRSLLVEPLDLTHAPHPRFLVQGHILNIGGDTLIVATSNC
jgi:hypothetical protein